MPRLLERIGSKLNVVKTDGLAVGCVIKLPEGPNALHTFALSHDGRIVATTGTNQKKGDFTQIWRADAGTLLAEASSRGLHSVLGISPDNKMLVVGGYDDWVLVFNLSSTDWQTQEPNPGTTAPVESDPKNIPSTPTEPSKPRTLGDRLKGTKWINSNNVTFEWDADGSFFHKSVRREYEVIDDKRVRIVFSEKHIDTLVFDKDFQRFEQFSTQKPNTKPLFTGKRTN